MPWTSKARPACSERNVKIGVTTLPPIALIELASRIKAIREDQHRLPELEARLDMLLPSVNGASAPTIVTFVRNARSVKHQQIP